MPSRRAHLKSRNGCVNCKFSKVKCDELKPTCSRCIRREERCIYKEPQIPRRMPGSESSLPSPQSLALDSTRAHVPEYFWNAVFPYTTNNPSPVAEIRFENFRDRDLELLHHWSTCTYRSLADGFPLEEFWQITVIQVALSQPFLMHGLLALTACHLAYLRPEAKDHYDEIAMYHHASAVSLFRPVLDTVDSQSAGSAFAFAAIVGNISFILPAQYLGTPSSPSPGESIVKNILHVFRLERGVKGVLDNSLQSIRESVMAPLLMIPMGLEDGPLDFDAEIAVREVEDGIRNHLLSEQQRFEYLDAMNWFRQCYPRGKYEPRHRAAISGWPVMLRDACFADMLGMQDWFSLVILGYYGVLLNFMNETWWMGNRGRMLVEAVCDILSPEFVGFMEWPRKAVGIGVWE